ncbi:MAG: MBOAT family protein [Lachnospiraceae bacterium]|nr:MBOAT family protein [Lachnospiraceae bacterium]
MLFNSVIFIVVFLPLALIGWYMLQRLEKPVFAKVFLVGMSLWFYGYYNWWYLVLLVISVLLNYAISRLFELCVEEKRRKLLLTVGLAGNIGLLFYFKYFNFFLDNCNFFFHTNWQVEKIALPLGISFFTFQQISFLVDRYWKEAPDYSFWDYASFITYFPQLIAGPIVLHHEWIPQLQERKNRKINVDMFFDGTMLFILGFAKKVLLADVLAIIVNAEYASIAYLDAPAAWVTIICYMLELYFDFSGYCDMARGIGKMFGFVLPENFDSPLMAVSVKDFWRRWHKTLSRFLTTYIYIPLGGNRRGTAIKCRNLLIVFLVSGFWHGANWTYVVWGLLHGVAMVWENLFPKLRFRKDALNRLFTGIFVTLTFAIFRSESLPMAGLLFKKLFLGGNTGFLLGLCNTIQVPETYAIRRVLEMAAPTLQNPFYVLCLVVLLGVSLVLIGGRKAEQWIEEKGRTRGGLFLTACLFVWAFVSLSQVSTFLYFDF